jgi:hypothetical protein
VFVSCAASESAQSSGSTANRVIPDWVAHASRVLAKVSHFRGLFEEDRFGETPNQHARRVRYPESVRAPRVVLLNFSRDPNRMTVIDAIRFRR